MTELTDLFDPEPAQWGLRGDPWVWRAMRDHLAGAGTPRSAGEAGRIFFQFVVSFALVAEKTAVRRLA